MNKDILAVVATLIIIGGGYLAYVSYSGSDLLTEQLCAPDAKICPDGSAVGRTGPNCEFAECPSTAAGMSTLQVKVTLSPTCPVERTPPDPSCAPKPYSTSVFVSRDGQRVASKQTDQNGVATLKVAPGTYTVVAQGGNPLPMCPSGEGQVVVAANEVKTVDISCDTGIR